MLLSQILMWMVEFGMCLGSRMAYIPNDVWQRLALSFRSTPRRFCSLSRIEHAPDLEIFGA